MRRRAAPGLGGLAAQAFLGPRPRELAFIMVITFLVFRLGGLLTLLRRADPGHTAEFYRRLGLRLTYDHETRMVPTETRPAPFVYAKIVSAGGPDG